MTSLGDLDIIVVAAGASSRMGFDKIWATLAERPLCSYAVEAALAARPARVVLVVAPDRLAAARAAHPAVECVAGGERRRDSVSAGVRAGSSKWVAIHDAARPLVSARLFEAGYEAAQETGAAVPVVPVKDTVKRVLSGKVAETLPRALLALVQTPQVFRRDVLERALASSDEDATDEATLVERLGQVVAVFDGDEANFKVTTPLDFELATLLLRRSG